MFIFDDDVVSADLGLVCSQPPLFTDYSVMVSTQTAGHDLTTDYISIINISSSKWLLKHIVSCWKLKFLIIFPRVCVRSKSGVYPQQLSELGGNKTAISMIVLQLNNINRQQ